jgi:4-phytase/acid phosphatase/peptide/nickel transport system substrate-binding protein
MLLTCMACLLIAGCDTQSRSANTQKQGGTLYIGVETPFHGFDVLEVPSGGILLPAMAMIGSAVEEPLFRMDRAGSLISVLGLSATPSADGKTWDIALRKNVVFHDGTPFNAAAVVHHWRRMLDPDKRFRGRSTFQPIQAVEAVDDHQVRFTLEHPWAPFLAMLADDMVAFALIPSPTAVDSGTHHKKPVGTGPFKYHQWNAGDHFILLKNERYWQPGLPLMDKLVFRTIPDHQSRYASLVAGQVDAITLDRGHLIKKAQDDPSLHTHHHEASGAEIVRINTRHPPLDDVRVRQALALANDQALHVSMVYGGAIPFVHHPLGEWFKCTDNGYLEHDPQRARQLIADYGRPVELTCLHTNTSRGRATGELLQQLYKAVGVNLTPVGLGTGPHIRKVLTGDFQLATSRIYAALDFGPEFYRSLHSTSPTNYSGYSNPQMDALLEALRVETDPARRDEIMCRVVRRVNTDVPFFYRGGRRQHIVARKRIQDLMDPSGMRLNLATAWIDDKVKFNTAAFAIEKDSVVALECLDSGDTGVVKAAILGAWEGKDDWGATIKATFKADDTVTGGRTGSTGGTRKYLICGPEIHWEAVSGARIVVALTDDRETLDGKWTYASYSGTFVLKRISR